LPLRGTFNCALSGYVSEFGSALTLDWVRFV
jgi:hypothetical protein